MKTEALLSIARQAGDAIMRVYSQDFQVARKGDDSPLTEADLASHTVIVDRLAEEFPGIPVLSEESADVAPHEERRQWRCYWLVDPLDGTKEFIKRNGQFTVNIALMEGRRPVSGVVFAPARDWMYWGTVGAGAFKSVDQGPAVPIRCRPIPELDAVRVVTSSSHQSPETSAYLDALRANHREISFVHMGSSLKICMVAEGEANLYPRLAPTMEWDTAAAHAVLNAAGGVLLRHGSAHELRYNKEDLRNDWFVAGPSSKAGGAAWQS